MSKSRMARRIPPLNPLHVFEVVARAGSLTRAADELHISQSAVSRQIAVLEGYLNVRLFQRERRGVTLTPLGAAYLRDIGPAFALIASGTERLLAEASGGPLRVRTYATFVAKWLLKRLPDFQSRHPEIEVRIATAVPEVDFDKDAADVAIQFGHGQWPKADAELLFFDEIEPVCSPALLKGSRRLERIDDLAGMRLLHAHYRRADWPDWLASVGRSDLLGTAREMTFPSSMFAYQAAIDGVGVAMGQTLLLQQEFESGQLTRPFRRPIQRDAAYYLLTAASQTPSVKVRAFRRWLLDEVRQQQPA
ncbi:MAG TPA: transcriptional regulator GcvA [Quisquiliibacterium sp.]|nr:transcriptional regulator GcvA [Quisquiliibacterium sp.]